MPKNKPFLQKYLPLILLLILLITVIPLLPHPDFLRSEEDRFTEFTEQVFQGELRGSTLNMHYVIADPDAYELGELPVTLGDGSLKARQQSVAVLENYKNTLENFDYEKLSADSQLTWDIFHSYLETELSGAPFLLYDEPLSPTLGIQAQLPILLAEYTFRTKGDIEDYLCLLTQIPDYFSSILAFERDKADAGLFMSDDSAFAVISQCKEFIADNENNYLIDIFNEKIDAVTNLTVDEKTAYKTRNRSILEGYVIPAYESLISGIGALEGSGVNEMGLYYLPDGPEYYEYLIRSTVGDSRPIAEIEEAIKTQIVADYEAIRTLSGQITAKPQPDTSDQTTAGTQPDTSGQTTAETQSETASAVGAASRKPEVYLSELRSKITEDFPLIPNVSCQIRYVHDSLQEYLSPAFYLTPPLDDYKNNVIYINPAGGYDDLELFTTLAHEGYPGHLYQTVFFHAQSPNLLRQLLDVSGYTEGWATYVEMYACSLWEENPLLASLYRYNRSFTLGLASLLDIGIHYRGYSLDETAAFLKQLGFDSDMAQSMYQSILQTPANYLKYYVGYLNFTELCAKAQQKERFSLKEFHRFILETGPAPFSILEARLETLTFS